MHVLRIAAATITATLSWFAAAGPAAPASGVTAAVGPGFTISMGAKHLGPGTYTITIHDRSSIHNFHLTGPGVNRKTTIGAVGTFVWHVALKRGTYRFNCDAHASLMHGVLRVT